MYKKGKSLKIGTGRDCMSTESTQTRKGGYEDEGKYTHAYPSLHLFTAE